MTARTLPFQTVRSSLPQLLGEDYVTAACAARAALTGHDADALFDRAGKEVDFFPASLQDRLRALLPHTGEAVSPPYSGSSRGASASAFNANSKPAQAPLSALGYFRAGEDGRLYLATKSEHYHAPLGHAFPGYELVQIARDLGIPNATHNNTRGHITRLLERDLVRAAAGIDPGDAAGLDALIASDAPASPNRVLNLETGSLAAEAALKLALARFYQAQADSRPPRYAGRTPVVLVLGDDDGGLEANYHGTTMLTQVMRGMWNGLRGALDAPAFWRVRAVKPNNLDSLEEAFRTCSQPPFKVAAFFHELIMMNYGGLRLTDAFVSRMYALCAQHDALAVVDEIQTGVWSPELFMFREYGVVPDIAVIGKGFPGGEYAASRILFKSKLDTLPQFGALVTNGQEELASLAYLVTMRWAEANAPVTRAIGEHYEQRLRDMAVRHAARIARVEGRRHLAGVYFHELPAARAFVEQLNAKGFDISVQTYKTGCPPSALTKIPLIADMAVVDFVVDAMETALKRL